MSSKTYTAIALILGLLSPITVHNQAALMLECAQATAGTVFISDSFTEGADTALESHTTDQGDSWVLLIDGYDILAVDDNVSQAGTAAALFYVNTTPPSADYTAEVDITCASSDTDEGSIGIRHDGSSGATRDAYYVVYFPDVSGGQARLYKVVNGTNTQLGSSLNHALGTPPTTFNLKISASGTTISAWIDDNLIASVTDSDITAAGFAGMGTGYRESRDAQSITYDNFLVYE